MSRLHDEIVTLAHGAGGKATRALVEHLFLEELGAAPQLAALGDSAVHGTVNDLAMAGARPLWLAAGFVLEEGLAVAELRAVVRSLGEAARAAGVAVVAGDTKVVERGKGDGIYVTTAGIGVLEHDVELAPARVQPGDRIRLSGTIGDHGVAIMVARGGLDLEVALASDTAPLHELSATLLDRLGDGVRWLRDPTRGGLATALNELAAAAGTAVVLDEAALPVRPEVAGACEILGLDPLTVANEGKLVAVVADRAADEGLALLRAHPLGAAAALVGRVEAAPAGLVLLDTAFGGRRIVDMLVGDPLPRIC